MKNESNSTGALRFSPIDALSRLLAEIEGLDADKRRSIINGFVEQVQESKAVDVSEEELKETLDRFKGDIDQLPPMYSAVSVGGTRLYKLARQGVEVERKAREIEISELELLSSNGDEHLLRVACSKGTYVRTLCHDIGESLGCGACMSSLRRTAIGNFTLEQALTFQDVERLRDSGELEKYILPTDSVFAHLPAVTLNEEGQKRADNGAFIVESQLSCGAIPENDSLCRVYSSAGEFIMLGRGGELDKGGRALFCHKTFFIRD